MIGGLLGAYGASQYWTRELAAYGFVPSRRFARPAPLPPQAYADPAMWYAPARSAEDPARWSPRDAPAQRPLPVAVFFVHPTSHFDRHFWNAPLDDPRADAQARLFLRGLATPFADAEQLWAPRYRQATFGAFLDEGPQGAAALDLAYGDVAQAFAHFLVQNPDAPIVLAGHSQGAFHLIRLLREQVAGRPLAKRIVAAYLVGWPVSLAQDLPALGLPACQHAGQSGCILSWQSFAQPADTSTIREAYQRLARRARQTGAARTGDGAPYLCTNPITGAPNSTAPAAANLGTLVPDLSLSSAGLEPAKVGAQCSPEGFLLIDNPPRLGPLVLPGNNYHVYDIPLFWANLREDVRLRSAHYLGTAAP